MRTNTSLLIADAATKEGKAAIASDLDDRRKEVSRRRWMTGLNLKAKLFQSLWIEWATTCKGSHWTG